MPASLQSGSNARDAENVLSGLTLLCFRPGQLGQHCAAGATGDATGEAKQEMDFLCRSVLTQRSSESFYSLGERLKEETLFKFFPLYLKD